jgi:aldose 1-epimerase
MKSKYIVIFLFISLIYITSCTPKQAEEATSLQNIEKTAFGTTPDGSVADLYTLTNINGLEMKVTNYGGIITSLMVPDRDGVLGDIVLGYDTLQGYMDESPYFGAIIGRYGNRIANGSFKLDTATYTLAQNNGPNHLHGGLVGFDKVLWNAETINNETGVGLVLTYTSKDGEEGYPGNLQVKVIYTLSNDNTLEFDYQAETDKTTVVNLTQHSYFNLSSEKEDILNHQLVINASSYLPVDTTLIPTGELRNVEGTPFDFTSEKAVGQDINEEDEQLANGLGYDHCWILNEGETDMKFAASVYYENTGRFMEIYTTEPAIQFYSGNFLEGNIKGKNGVVYAHRYGLCLETQHYPDSPNQPEFPSTVLNPGEKYHTTTRLKFSTK